MATSIDYNLVLKLRLVVARYGEMDAARWWNTNGVLGPIGASAIKRGFPKTHPFVRARIVFTVARERCRELFTHPDCVTLWELPAAIEDQVDAQWHSWLDAVVEWQPFFNQLEKLPGSGLLDILSAMELITQAQVQQVGTLQRSTAGWAIVLPGERQPDNETVALLAAAFARGETGKPVVPYARLEGHA